ncbi:hypothetical protein [Actinacidiphila glaucinigra]|uniref:hypothetical protein n=1 Tax=Actinacidiphila glaucinigra TaxID=235986 RepID=UPI003D8EB0DD
MSAPAAAVAVIRAELEEAYIAELLSRPGNVAQRVVRALERSGWTIAPTDPENGPQTPA